MATTKTKTDAGTAAETGKREPVYAVVWQPQGSQADFLRCPYFECLFSGTRGSGKSDALLMDYAQHVGQGFGMGWRGIIFRQSYKQLADIVVRSRKWFSRIFPQATFNTQDFRWTFPGGEELLFRHMEKESDYWSYHGHEYPFIGWEELCNWPSGECYESMKSCSRSSTMGMPRKYRATTNPWGPGFNWVKQYFVNPVPMGHPYRDPETLETRVTIYGSILENKKLLEADPGYVRKLKANRNLNKRKAWLLGSWDIVAGGALDDVWDETIHVVRPFQIPRTWRVDRSFDWGSSKPFSVGWWAESDGTAVKMANGQIVSFPRGTLFRIAEWYGWNGRANEGCRMLAVNVASQMREFEKRMHLDVRPGPADSNIFYGDNGVSIANDMASLGIYWTMADKGPGSRRLGLELMRKKLEASLSFPIMEEPGLFIFNTCRHFVRTVPVLPRDERDPDDILDTAEDHIYDETRYRVLANPMRDGMRECDGV